MVKEQKINIAVITPTCRDYAQFINDNPSDIKEYTWVYSMDKVRGKKFDDVIKLYRYYEITDIEDILKYLKYHKKTKTSNSDHTILKTGGYTVDRKRFILWASLVVERMVKKNIQNDLIKGNEYVITAEDVLENCEAVPSFLIEEFLPKEIELVHHSIIKIIYKQPEDEIFTTTITEQ